MATNLYQQHFGLLTRHGKENVIAPLLAQHLNASLTVTGNFDTDNLGTFSGEVKRELTPKECAFKKAVLATELTGLSLGLGSEGSFGASAYGFGVFNQELITCYDRENNWSVTGCYAGFSSARSQIIENIKMLDDFLTATPPDQALTLKSTTQLEKGIYGADNIRNILNSKFGESLNHTEKLQEPITVSYDLRAYHCPERRIHIAKACENLIERLKAICPECKTPGFWPDKSIAGLTCCGCGAPTKCTKARIATCTACNYSATYPTTETFAKQDFCDFCNP